MRLFVAAALLLLHLGFVRCQFTPKDNYLIDCGGQGQTSLIGRNFTGDSDNKHVSSGSPVSGTISDNSKLTAEQSSVYGTARVFTGQGDYRFDVNPGRHWIRLHFLPFTTSQGTDLTTAFFSVGAGDFVLLNNASVSNELASRAKSPAGPSFPIFLLKEYSINVTSSSLIISFTPSNGSVAFVNAIEVISMPEDVYKDDGQLLGQGTQSAIGLPDKALQTMYRLNVGGLTLDSSQDSWLSRSWIRDDLFLIGARKGNLVAQKTGITYPPNVPKYTAPETVYGTARTSGVSNIINTQFNLTWNFTVDTGYTYFVRLHFCEIVYTTMYARIFDVFINHQVATKGMDVVALSGAASTASFMDFVVNMNDGGSVLTLELSPNLESSSKAQFNDTILNGLEIFKASNNKGSLAGTVFPDGVIPGQPGGSQSGVSAGAIVGGVAAGLAAMTVLIGGLCYLRRRSRPVKGKKSKRRTSSSFLPLHAAGNSTSIASKFSATSNKSGGTTGSSTATSSLGGKFFTFAEIMEATNNFDESLLLGVGGFGKVYGGELFDGTKVAVKRGNPRSEQGLTEFQTEIEMLSKLRHRHLVSLIGYCEEHCEMILVYECMANGTLRAHLYGSDMPSKPLSWKQRLEICIGAARGLHYLHTGAAQGIIHRDVKTTNILLDENFVAKVSDFGLSKTGPSLDRTHVSTAVKGSFGYLDPEYFRRQQLTEKSDVYSFGVVLFEVLCARPAINPTLPRDQVNIAEWAMHYQRMGMLEQIVDPNLKGQIKPTSLAKFGETAEKCLAEQGIDRPTMGDVLWNLEYAQQLQESINVDGDDSSLLMDTNGDANVNGNGNAAAAELPLRDHVDYHRHLDEDFEDASASAVFSQLVNPQGR